MARMFAFVLATILSLSSVVLAEDLVIYIGPSGYTTEQSEIMTEYRVEEGVSLTHIQMGSVLGGETIHYMPIERTDGWNWYYTHIVYKVTSSAQVYLDGNTIRKVVQEGVSMVEVFNPVFYLWGAYVLLMVYAHKTPERQDATAFAFAAFFYYAIPATFAAAALVVSFISVTIVIIGIFLVISITAFSVYVVARKKYVVLS